MRFVSGNPKSRSAAVRSLRDSACLIAGATSHFLGRRGRSAGWSAGWLACLLLAGGIVGLLPGGSLAAPPAEGSAAGDPIDYQRDIKPLLRAKCIACHGALKQEGGLRLDTRGQAVAGGDSGPALAPGDPAASLLLQRVREEDDSLRMPQEAEPLTERQVELLERWIRQGAGAPADEQPEQDPRRHWAFLTPRRPPLPAAAPASWNDNPIDAFLAEQYRRHGLVPVAEAEPQQLLRRVYLDLVGVPPTRHELRAFLQDPSPQAYRQVVDRLLASPRYGERWGRHWMDVWRYSDWYGRRGVPDVLNSYGQIWRWRDWIVRSLNQDRGYDQMVREMLAADELTPNDPENQVATGFLVRNFYRWNYNTWLKDTVEHTGKAFLGLTLNCCHCHDHKYDPITNEEYFRFRAFFEPMEIRHDPVAGEPDPGPYPKYDYGKAYKPITSGMVRIMDERLDAETYVYTGGESRNVIPGRPPVTPGAPAVLAGDQLSVRPVSLPAESWYPGLRPFVRQQALREAQAGVDQARQTLTQARTLLEQARALPEQPSDQAAREAAEQTLAVDQANLERAEAAYAAVEARIRADQVRYQGRAGDADQAARAAVRAERTAVAAAARVEQARAQRALAAARRTLAAAQQTLATAQQPVAAAQQTPGTGTPGETQTEQVQTEQVQTEQVQTEQVQAERAKVEAAQAEVTKAEQQLVAARAAREQAERAVDEPSTQYTAFSAKYPDRSTGRRTALAHWLTSRRNPLTARVAVNHIWLRHFGQALVETTENFGRNGAAPTHPELLDWLACELMEHDWQMKHIHRLIVTSHAYRLASTSRDADPVNLQRDQDNRYLWKFPARRMEAEVVRDSLLQVAGELDSRLGGREIAQSEGLTSRRRSLYFEHHGEGRMQMLELFDAADPCDCYRRGTSVRPQQALALANSELTIRQGRLLARRLSRELPRSDAGDQDQDAFIRAAFEQVLSRGPSGEERQASLEFLRQQVELFQAVDPAALAADPQSQTADAQSQTAGAQSQTAGAHSQTAGAQSQMADPRSVPPSTDPRLRARENLVQALLNHHDFVTIR